MLGSFEVRDGAEVLALGGARQRSLLAALLLRANETAFIDYLTNALWERPPVAPEANIRTYVSALRRRLGTDRLTTRPGGYLLRVESDELDLAAFRRLTGRADQAVRDGDPATAAADYGEALKLWRGAPLAGLETGPELRAELDRLAEQQITVVERHTDVRLALGQHAELVAELRSLVAANPLRERLWERLMLALHRSGRRADALHAYQEIYRILDTELGIAPGGSLQQLHATLLADDTEVTTRALERRPNQLPAQTAHYTGRADELSGAVAQLSRVTDTPSVVTVTGQPGVGKTAFAVRLAHRTEFPDGQLFVDLRGASAAPPDPSDVLARFLRDLGVAGVDIPQAPDERAAAFRDRLSGKRMLLVLDNAANEEQVRPLLPGEPGCGVLVTSRRRLTGLDASHQVRLEPLAPADSVALLTSLSGDSESPARERIARLCGGLPLALRIVGTKLRSLSHLTSAGLAERLENERDRLDELVGGDREVRAGFALSYSGLDPVDQHVFRVLAKLPGTSFRAWAVAAALGEDLRVTERTLDRLVEANLLEAGGRYHFHDLIRLFAEEQEVEAHEQIRDRVLAAYLHVAQRADRGLEFGGLPRFTAPGFGIDVDPLVRDPAAWFDEEHPNVLAAIRIAADAGLDELVCQLSATIAPYCELRAQWDHLTEVAEVSLGAARRIGSAYWAAYALFARGLAARETRDFARAEAWFRECVRLLPEAADPRLEVITMLAIGVARRLQGKWDEAHACFDACLAKDPDLGWRAYTLREKGILHRYRGEWELAERALRPAADIYESLGSPRWHAACLRELGVVRREVGDFAGAHELLTTARDTFREVGDRRREASAWRSLAFNHRAADRIEMAYACAVESRLVFSLTLDEHGAAGTFVCLAELESLRGNSSAAAGLAAQALEVFERQGDQRWIAKAATCLDRIRASTASGLGG
ncbi:AfsR/SARP family transcriptional regulator [Lentzea tibetensis]|uniref:AfsR/SARP family transcriptional regulator n=1 Tax=Lentzea tibetensis TaxID=2591470 RepID=UPI001648B734|nr:BTAD domain-containing putative transcriptional regulator [Lentzea tibetensis]